MNKRRSTIIQVVLVVVPILLLSLFVVTKAGAQANYANAAQGLQISPALVELNAKPGNTYTIKLSVLNVTASDLDYSTEVNDFETSDETGSPRIINNNNLPDTVSVRTWLSKISDFGLKSRQTKTIDVSISVPLNAEPGGHYGVVHFSGSAPEVKDTGVGLAASAGALILIRVDGKITEEANLTSFYASTNGNEAWFFENGPITFVTRVENIGNVHIKPVGTIELRDIFGNLVKTMTVNEDKSNVLPNGTRRFESIYDQFWMFGFYTANLAIGYGTTGQAITTTINFWVIPYKLIAVILFIIVTLFFITKRLIKVYNRRIIEKAKKDEASNKNKATKNKN